MSTLPHELLTPDNCVVALIDHQPQMLFGVSNFDRQSVINNTVGLAKAAKLFGVPTILRRSKPTVSPATCGHSFAPYFPMQNCTSELR